MASKKKIDLSMKKDIMDFITSEPRLAKNGTCAGLQWLTFGNVRSRDINEYWQLLVSLYQWPP